jgi:hypothetical protein
VEVYGLSVWHLTFTVMGTPSVGDYEAEEDQLKECQYYTVEDLFCCGYARYFWEAIKIRYPEYCFYKDWEDMYAEN